MTDLNVLRLSHVCVRVTDLDRAENFYVNLLGFVETEKDGDYLYLRGIEEGQHHSLVLKKASSPGLCYVGFRVKGMDKVTEFSRTLKFKEKGVESALLTESPGGIPLLFYEDMEYVGDMRLKFHLHKGVSPVRLAHVNFLVKDLAREEKFFRELGFIETEHFLDNTGRKTVSWLTRRGNSHEIAVAESSRNVPGFHHETYYVHDVKEVVKAADILSSVGYWDNLERGPGRHGATEGYYVYLRDLDGNRVEFFTGDYEVLDPDKWKVVEWTHDQFRYRSDFWGRPIPDSWLKEWMPVEDLNGELRRW
ncbi:3,4-dihydroxyphenylacetate 2,3-dioxygenase [Metallosphaera hakonensis]|uniref:3,4-dihydroxyphenylacetate 2,3-dioxygenase n=1 Tax=Metallosphaera hakonensis JCM 8857 = DSM 7519 TaxID=1293036 RepID=A0A2U9IRA5_9CREN|nr:3,4-dihydroxyphenylacetate 2,3-dioxygenase [Metallosphaera hakonensis]AWR98513.1 3,4-dihydroxyphenylacetate 2,3-dioxygenase [Metallosphaera hakonensis JCM 8857 = DSM 7519]